MIKVLVVEDEELIRRGIILGLDWASLDCVVVGEAANGQEALEAVQKYNPTLIITDLNMPGMDGIEMVKKIRESGNYVPVIILTAYDRFDYVQSALRLGAIDYLLKPFRDGELEEAIVSLKKRIGNHKEDRESLLFPSFKKGDKSRYVEDTLEYIAEHFKDPGIGVGSIAEHLGISEGHLSHIFKKETDYTLLNYLTRYRIHKAMKLLREGRLKIYEVAEQVGYRDIAYFSTIFKKIVGVPPSEYQDNRGS